MINRLRHLVALAASTSSEHERRSAIEQAHRVLSNPDVAIVSVEEYERLRRRVAAAEEESARAEEEIRALAVKLREAGERRRGRKSQARSDGAAEPLDVTLGRAAGDVAAKAARDVVGGVVRDLFSGRRW